MKNLLLWIPKAALFISMPLTMWDMYNERVIESMGMAWDVGPPVWPYETPAILLYSMNFPAHLLFQPIANALGLVSPKHHLLIFPATIAWWWFVQSRLQRSSVVRRRSQQWLSFVALLIFAAALWLVAGYVLIDATRWWLQYGNLSSAQTLRMVRAVAPGLWGVFLGTVAALAAKRVVATR